MKNWKKVMAMLCAAAMVTGSSVLYGQRQMQQKILRLQMDEYTRINNGHA